MNYYNERRRIQKELKRHDKSTSQYRRLSEQLGEVYHYEQLEGEAWYLGRRRRVTLAERMVRSLGATPEQARDAVQDIIDTIASIK